MPLLPPFYAISRNFTVELLVAGALLTVVFPAAEAQQSRPQTPAGTSGAVSLPAWVPVYPGAKVEIDSHSTNTKSEMQFTGSTSARCPQVVAFYEKQLTLAGFSVVNGGFSNGDCGVQMNSHDPLGARAVNLYFGTRVLLTTPPKSLTEFSMQVVQIGRASCRERG